MLQSAFTATCMSYSTFSSANNDNKKRVRGLFRGARTTYNEVPCETLGRMERTVVQESQCYEQHALRGPHWDSHQLLSRSGHQERTLSNESKAVATRSVTKLPAQTEQQLLFHVLQLQRRQMMMRMYCALLARKTNVRIAHMIKRVSRHSIENRN